MTLLGGGQDWLTHESFARDILLNGPLMTLGKPLGEGRTFYAQPFYPYALAAMHWLTGEDQFGVVVVQLSGSAWRACCSTIWPDACSGCQRHRDIRRLPRAARPGPRLGLASADLRGCLLRGAAGAAVAAGALPRRAPFP